MDDTVPLTTFDNAYAAREAPWVIDEPQPAIVELEHEGWIRGHVLDAGTGTGEHTLLLTRLGYDVLGIDFSLRAVEQARANAVNRGIEARFEVADALQLSGKPHYDTVIDSALFHVFGGDDRRRYARTLHRVVRPGGIVHVLALSDTEPGIGPRISDTAIRDAFADGWEIDDLRPNVYRGIAYPEAAVEMGVAPYSNVNSVAWLARARRV